MFNADDDVLKHFRSNGKYKAERVGDGDASLMSITVGWRLECDESWAKRQTPGLPSVASVSHLYVSRCDYLWGNDDLDRGWETVGASNIGDSECEAEDPFFNHKRRQKFGLGRIRIKQRDFTSSYLFPVVLEGATVGIVAR